MRFKIASVAFFLILLLAAILLPASDSFITPETHCLTSTKHNPCVHCFHSFYTTRNLSGVPIYLSNIQQNAIVVNVDHCLNYSCQQLLPLVDQNQATPQLEQTKQAKQYLEKLSFQQKKHSGGQINVPYSKSIIVFSNKQEQPLKLHYIPGNAILGSFLLEFLMFLGVISMTVWHFWNIWNANATQIYIVCTIFKLVVGLLVVTCQFMVLVENSMMKTILRFVLIMLTYLGLIYAIEVHPIIKYLELIAILDSYLLCYLGFLDEQIMYCLIIGLSVLILIISFRRQRNSSFKRKTKRLASINLILFAVSEVVVGISPRVITMFLNMFLINLSLIYIEPEQLKDQFNQQNSIGTLDSMGSTISVEEKYKYPEQLQVSSALDSDPKFQDSIANQEQQQLPQ